MFVIKLKVFICCNKVRYLIFFIEDIRLKIMLIVD